MNLTVEDKLLLTASGLNLSEKSLLLVDELVSSVSDWNYFTNNVIRNSVAPLVYKNVSLSKNQSEIPQDTLFKFKQVYIKSLSRNMVLYEHFRNAVNAFSAHGISVIALKGIFLAESIYRDIGLRQMSDIDILAKKEDVENCRRILLDSGYKSYERFKTNFIKDHLEVKHIPPLVLNNVSIEIHLKVLPDDYHYNVNIENYWENAKPVTINGTNTLALSPNDLLQHLCVHLDHHFSKGKIQLFSFCDIAEVIKYYQNKIDWDLLEETCTRYNCTKNIFSLLFLTEKYFNVTLPDHIIRQAGRCIDAETEDLFILYLKGNGREIARKINNNNIERLQKINGFTNKIKYLLGDTFPTRTFMKQRYLIKQKPLIYWYYLVRIKSGVIGLFSHLLKSKRR